jgi:diguanylate cyclase (GGDEF)-like protein/PAS domain S-box-containing protein
MKQDTRDYTLKAVDSDTHRFKSLQKGERWLITGSDPDIGADAIPDEAIYTAQPVQARNLISEKLSGIFKEHGYVFISNSDRHRDFYSSLDESEESIAVLSFQGEFKWINTAWADQFGFSLQELQAKDLMSIVVPEYQQIVRKKIEDSIHSLTRGALKTKETPLVMRCRNGFGDLHSCETMFHAYWCDGEVALAAVMRDITYQQGLVERLQRLEKHYSVLTETVNEAIIRIDEKFNIVFANSAVTRTFGYTKEELLGRNFRMLFPPEIFRRHEDEFKKYFIVDDEHRSTLGLKRSIEVLGAHKSRGVSPMEMSFGNSSDFQGRTLTCIIRDITQRKNIERQLRKLAYHDRLTNLGNRDLFNHDMQEVLDQMEKYPMLNGALMFLDLDGFKQINDSLGHKVGDELLLKTAGRLRGCLRESDSIYRFGGDEFVVLLRTKDPTQAHTVVDRIRLDITLQLARRVVDGDAVGVTAGFAVSDHNQKSLMTLVRQADSAMVAGKRRAKAQTYAASASTSGSSTQDRRAT